MTPEHQDPFPQLPVHGLGVGFVVCCSPEDTLRLDNYTSSVSIDSFMPITCRGLRYSQFNIMHTNLSHWYISKPDFDWTRERIPMSEMCMGKLSMHTLIALL